MFRIIGYVVVTIGLLLNTMFGLGPVILADGGRVERVMTFVVVISIYAILIALLLFLRKKKEHR